MRQGYLWATRGMKVGASRCRIIEQYCLDRWTGSREAGLSRRLPSGTRLWASADVSVGASCRLAAARDWAT